MDGLFVLFGRGRHQRRQPRGHSVLRQKLRYSAQIVRTRSHRIHSRGAVNVDVDKSGEEREAVKIDDGLNRGQLISF